MNIGTSAVRPSLLYFLICLSSCGFFLLACGTETGQSQTGNKSLSDKSISHNAQSRSLVLAATESGNGAPNISEAHVDAALNLCLQLVDTWDYRNLPQRNAALDSIETLGESPTAAAIGTALQADALAFVRVDRVQNLLRVEVTLRSGAQYANSSQGLGWDVIRYRRDEDNAQVTDLALTTALQRALAAASGDSLLFATAEKPYDVQPAAPLVVTGLSIAENAASGWNLFNEHIVNSYHAVVAIGEEARKHEQFVAVDIDTRDTMYAMNGFYLVENYRPPTDIEIQTLQFFGVEYVLGGALDPITVEHKPQEEAGGNAAEIRLDLARLTPEKLIPVANVSGRLHVDSRDSLTARLHELTAELLDKAVTPPTRRQTKK